MLPVPDRAGTRGLDARDEERGLRVAEPERREPVELLCEVERQLARGHDRVDLRQRSQVDLRELLVGVAAECVRERLQLRGLDREPGCRTMPSEPVQVARARRKPAVEIELGDRATGALPALAALRDEDDRPVEPLDEPRGDDPDHTLVPALVPEDVAAPRALDGRQRVDARRRLAEDPLLDALPLAVQILELRRERVGLRAIFRQEEVEREVGSTEPARPR